MYKKWGIVGIVLMLLISVGYNIKQYRAINSSIETKKQEISNRIEWLSKDIEGYGENGTEKEIKNFLSEFSALYGMTSGTSSITKNSMLDRAILSIVNLFNNESPETIKAKCKEIAPVLVDISKDLGNMDLCIKLIDIIWK